MNGFGGFAAMFGLMQVFFVIFFLFVVGAIIFAIVKNVNRAATNSAAPEVSAQATVLDKRIETSGGGDSMVTQTHFVSFEQASGERFELEVPPASTACSRWATRAR
jgi:hypothetical protein